MCIAHNNSQELPGIDMGNSFAPLINMPSKFLPVVFGIVDSGPLLEGEIIQFTVSASW